MLSYEIRGRSQIEVALKKQEPQISDSIRCWSVTKCRCSKHVYDKEDCKLRVFFLFEIWDSFQETAHDFKPDM